MKAIESSNAIVKDDVREEITVRTTRYAFFGIYVAIDINIK
jgi:hypothetical protein